jgi:beta-lactamase regulating signal transducer with metallopeptidase domain
MSAIADHLWQSTWFVLAAWLFALFVRQDAARIRFCVWLAASIKFLFPFALLSWIGTAFVVQVDDEAAWLPVMKHVASPLTTSIAVDHVGIEVQWLLLAIWAPVAAVLLERLLASWVQSRALVSSSTPCDVIAPIPVRCSDRVASPAVVGILDPVLLLPRNLPDALSQLQLRAVISHEMWHVRRHDNLVFLVHSIIQALFWFHPLVWLIGAKLVSEREHACDEGVIEDNEPLVYAETLLKVCRYSLESQCICAAGATSGDLAARIRAITAATSPAPRSGLRRLILGAALLACGALAVASGMTVVVTSALTVAAGTRSIHVSEASGPSLLVIKDDYVYGRNVSLRELIGRACAVSVGEVSGEVRELDHPRYDVAIRASIGHNIDRKRLIADLLQQRFNVRLIERTVRRPITN